jgi:hypothetical protein
MSVTAQNLVSLEFRGQTFRPANKITLGPECARLAFTQEWQLVQATTLAPNVTSRVEDPFHAIEHSYATTLPNLSLADDDEAAVPRRSGGFQTEYYRGKQGRLVVVHKRA